jgi:hypothetical protein
VYLAFSRDETLMGLAFPKEEREAALETYPDRFLRPEPSDMRYQWLVVRLDAIDKDRGVCVRVYRSSDSGAACSRCRLGFCRCRCRTTLDGVCALS